MLKLVPGTLIQYNEVERSKFAFLWHCNTVVKPHFWSRVQGVVIDCCTSGESWKQVIGLFIEYGAVARLEERIEHCMPAL